MLQALLKRAENRLQLIMPPKDFDQFMDSMSKNELLLTRIMREKKLRKLAKLTSKDQLNNERNNATTPTFNFAPAVVNLSQTIIPADQLRLLEKGQKFAINPCEVNDKIKKTLLTDLAVGLRSDLNFKNLFNVTLENLQSSSKNQNTVSYFRLRKLIKEQNLTILKADKSETLITLSRSDYNAKVLDFLHSANATPITDTASPNIIWTRDLLWIVNDL